MGDEMNVLITGAASGIGFNTGVKLSKLGYEVILTTETNKQLKVLREKIDSSLKIKTFKLDVKDENDRRKLENIDVDILISNAAIGIGGSILESKIKDIKNIYEVNVFSNIEIIKIVLKKMLYKNSGKIIIISSMIANIPLPFLGIYASTKSSISMLSQCLKKEIKLINKNIDISIIEPGIYKTGFNKVMLDYKYDDNESKFNGISNSLMNIENKILKFAGSKNIDSISNKIVKVVNKENTKSIYRAPFLQNILIKLYIKIFKR